MHLRSSLDKIQPHGRKINLFGYGEFAWVAHIDEAGRLVPADNESPRQVLAVRNRFRAPSWNNLDSNGKHVPHEAVAVVFNLILFWPVDKDLQPFQTARVKTP